jgi:hypothetical protein
VSSARQFFDDVLVNAVANFLCLLLPILIVFIVYRRFVKRRLRRFFGISAQDGTVDIRLSSIDVTESRTAAPLSGPGFVGPAITAAEYQYALYLSRVIDSPRRAVAAYWVLDLLGLRVVDRPVVCRIQPSLSYGEYLPATTVEREVEIVAATHSSTLELVEVVTGTSTEPPELSLADENSGLVRQIRNALEISGSHILVGSSVYNVLTRYVLEHAGRDARVVFLDSPSEPHHAASAVRVLPEPGGDPLDFPRKVEDGPNNRAMFREYFVLQRFPRWQQTDSTIFLAAGNSTAATAAAIATLADDWPRLAKEYGTAFTLLYSILVEDREVSDMDPAEGKNPWKLPPRLEWSDTPPKKK